MGKQNHLVSLLLKKYNSSFLFLISSRKTMLFDGVPKVDRKKLPLSTTGGNIWLYYNFNQKLEAPNREKTQVTKSRFALLVSLA